MYIDLPRSTKLPHFCNQSSKRDCKENKFSLSLTLGIKVIYKKTERFEIKELNASFEICFNNYHACLYI